MTSPTMMTTRVDDVGDLASCHLAGQLRRKGQPHRHPPYLLMRLSWQWSWQGERIGRHHEVEPLGVDDAVAAGLHHQIAGVEAAVPSLVHNKYASEMGIFVIN